MMMRNRYCLWVLILASLVALLLPQTVSAHDVPGMALTNEDLESARERLQIIEAAVADADSEAIIELIDPTAEELIARIEHNLRNTRISRYQMGATPLDQFFEIIDEETLRMSVRFVAKGYGWSTNDSAYFDLKKVNDSWVIVDTDFDERFAVPAVINWLNAKWLPLLLIKLILIGLWLWSLHVLLNSRRSDKAVWALLATFLPLFGPLFVIQMAREETPPRRT